MGTLAGAERPARSLPRITPVGITVAIAAVALGAMGVSLGYVALTIAAAGAAALLVAGWIVTSTVPRLDVHREIEPLRVERGRVAMGLVLVHNPRRWRSRACTAIEQLPDAEVTIAIAALRGGQSTSVPYRLPTRRRGALEVGPLAITRSDPLGLWQARRVVRSAGVLLVQPRVHMINPRPGGRTHHLEGPLSETAPRGTLTFHTLREYVAGDDIRRVHWKTTARTGKLMVREHVDTSQPSTVIVLDTRSDRYEADAFEDAVDVAASMVAASQRLGFPVRFVTTSGITHLVRAGQHGQQLADFLASVQPVAEGSVQRAAVAALGGRDHDVVLVVSGGVDAADLAQVTQLTRRFGYRALVTVRGQDPAGPRWPAGTHLDGSTAAQALRRWQLQQAAA